MDDTYEALRRAITLLRLQLALLPRHHPQRDGLRRDLDWCYHEAFAVIERRSAIRRAGLPPVAEISLR